MLIPIDVVHHNAPHAPFDKPACLEHRLPVRVLAVTFSDRFRFAREIEGITAKYARGVIAQAAVFQKQFRRAHGRTLLYLADEVYIAAGNGAQSNLRGITVTQSTGRADAYRYNPTNPAASRWIGGGL